MKLRRISAIAAIAAALAATTAAVYPRPPADRHRIALAGAAARRAGDTALASSLAAMRGHRFLDFNPRGQGLAVEVFGNLATATRVAILVPGSDTSLTTFDSRGTASPGGGAAALAAAAHRLGPGARLAIIAWLGYATPSTLSPAVMTSGDAGQGAAALRPFVNDLARHGRQVALLCHSYGSVLCGLAAPQLPVTDIAVYGSPGMDAPSVRALHTTARVWAGRGTGDWIRDVPHVHFLGLGFGQDPMAPAFGARHFGCGSGGHSGYFKPGSIALRNLAYIALGDPAGVTR